MKSKAIFVGFVLFIVFVFNGCAQQDNFPVLQGPYLGQKPPGLTPEIFAPGIISTEHEEFKAVFSPDGKELYYQLWGAPFPVILMMKEENGVWTKPQVAPFSGHIIKPPLQILGLQRLRLLNQNVPDALACRYSNGHPSQL